MKILDSVNLVREATAKQDLLPILQHLCFTGDSVFAYDDKMAIQAYCPTEIVGAVPADKFYGFIKSLSEDKVELKQNNESEFKIISGKSKIELKGMSVDSFIFEMPEDSDYEYKFVFDERFIKALQMCMKSVSTTYLLPVFAGITVEIKDNTVFVHSCEVETISRYSYLLEEKVDDYVPFILDGKFCKALISNFTKSENKSGVLCLNEDSALVDLDNCSMYVKLPAKVAHDIKEKFELSATPDLSYIDIPKELDEMLSRSILAVGKEGICRLYLDNGTLAVNTLPDDNTNSTIKLNESIEVEYEGKDIEVLVNPTLLKKMIDYCDKLCLTDETVVLDGGQYKALVGTYSQ